MSWMGLALGLIRDVAVSEAGQEILKDIRGTAPRKAPTEPPSEGEDLARWRRRVDEGLTLQQRNIAVLVEMLNAQEANLVRIQKRQRIWNLALAAGIVVAIAIPLAAWLLLQG